MESSDSEEKIWNSEENVSNEDEAECNEEPSPWDYVPDSILLMIFKYLNPKQLVAIGEVCRSWNRVSKDEMLWKDLFYRTFNIDVNIGILPGNIYFYMN